MGRGPHQALNALAVGLERKKVNCVFDAGIRGFFENLSHEWTLKLIEHRVADRRVLRLILKWLKAGVSEDGQWSDTQQGTPQKVVASQRRGIESRALDRFTLKCDDPNGLLLGFAAFDERAIRTCAIQLATALST